MADDIKIKIESIEFLDESIKLGSFGYMPGEILDFIWDEKSKIDDEINRSYENIFQEEEENGN